VGNALSGAPVQLVWLKKDLRLADHAPLLEAAHRGPCLVVYLYEPEMLRMPEFDGSHLTFLNDSLAELRAGLRERGGELLLRHGEAVETLEALYRQCPFTAIWSHMETGNALSYARDLRVKAWANARNLPWYEKKQNGVIRRLKQRDGWAERWQEQMVQPLAPTPARIPAPDAVTAGAMAAGPLLTHADLGLPPDGKPDAQPGGERHALETLESFLSRRGVNYRADMSSPVEGWEGCSRISPYLTWGNLSVKQAYHSLRDRVRELKAQQAEGHPIDVRWFGSLQSFGGRLRWHCHFMQKLEDEPAIEFENMARVFDGLREPHFNPAFFQAWCEGRTGYPMVDACMRALHRTGWINFRMRAMLVSFASYQLWLHWRPTAVYLARHFLDFEPGIHFSQFQMQSGVTGINTVRVYSPAKQVQDQDPQGRFIRKYVPELEAVPDGFLAEPHTMPPLLQQSVGCEIGKQYPEPIVDYRAATRLAKDRLFAVRKQAEAKVEARRVYQKHGSRRRPGVRPREDRNR
jgi:deoxyribodipyrimidine photo-lyase